MSHTYKSVRHALAMATCTLLQVPETARAEGWEADVAAMHYAESERVTVNEVVTRFRKTLADDKAVELKLEYDTMSGASPNGAVFDSQVAAPTSIATTPAPQTMTTPSGVVYTIGQQQTRTSAPASLPQINPLTYFTDTRQAATLAWEQPLSRTVKALVTGSTSTENDYSAYGGSATLTWALNQRLTALSVGAGGSHDTVKPRAGTPQALQSVTLGVPYSNGEKHSGEVSLGITQILSRQALAQMNYSYGVAQGYLTDPYKLLSVVTDSTNTIVDYRYEKRPDSRTRQSVFLQSIYHFTDDVLHLAYRYYWDDWEVRAHTVDIKYRYEFPWQGHSVQPHARWYHQDAAYFYRYRLASGARLPDYASADYRLGNLTDTSVGIKYAFSWGRKSEIGVRADYLRQQDTQQRFPTVKVIIVQLNLHYIF